MSDARASSDHGRAEVAAGPIDLLAIGGELTRLAEDREAAGRRVRRLLGFILRLTNGVGIAYLEVGDRQLAWREAIWKEADNGFQPSLLEAAGDAAKRSIGGQRVVVAPLELFTGYFVVAAPLVRDGRVHGVVNLLLVAPSLDDIQPFVAVLQAAMGFLHYGLLHEEAQSARWAVEQTAAMVELVSLAAAAPFFDEAVRIVVDRVQKHLGCHLVALGRAGRKRVKLAALSGSEHFDAWGSATGMIEGAMQEAFLAGEAVSWPRPVAANPAGADLADAAHQELHHALDLVRVSSVPLRHADGRILAVLTLMWRGDRPPPAEADRFIAAATPHLGAVLGALRRADPGNLRKWHYHLWGRLSRWRKALLFALVAAVIVVLAWPVAYPVRVDGVVEPEIRRMVSVQFDGLLKESLVKPGSLVAAGDLLAVMDDQQLLWRRAELTAARDRALRQRDLAMADPSAPVATAQMAQFEADGLELELKLIAFKQENLELRAPLAGMVLAGDHERARGIPVRQGEVLFEIGPVDRMLVELMIPAQDISLVAVGDALSLRLTSFPGRSWTSRITRIRPQAETVEGQSVFVAEAVLAPDETAALLAGMKGRASIEGATAPVGWVLTRRLWSFLRTTLFW